MANSYVILRQSHAKDESFNFVRTTLMQNHLWHPQDGAIPEWEALSQAADQRDNFDRAAAFLTENLKSRETITALVDEVNVEHLNPLPAGGWSSLIAMLILAFPEVRWVFLVVTGMPQPLPQLDGKPPANKDPEETEKRNQEREALNIWELVSALHGAGTVTDPRGLPLFDGYGLRQAVRRRMHLDHLRNPKSHHDFRAFPDRSKLAVVLDDETGFSRLEALMAYSRGFRAHAVASWNETERLLGKRGWLNSVDSTSGDTTSTREASVRATESETLLLSVEDLYVRFPDQRENQLSDLVRRDQLLPGLTKLSLHRRFVTVGHDRHNHGQAQARRQYLTALRIREAENTGLRLRKDEQLLLKPASGLYTLWDELGLHRTFVQADSPKEHRGLAPGFHWPPGKPRYSKDEDDGDGHSSPGRLLQIAENLLERATILIETTNTLNESVHGAVLTTQALELLGCRTPTISLEALSLKHQFEVRAESYFVGVEYHPSVTERLKDIRKNLESIGQWLDRKRRHEFVLHGEAQVVSHLISILNDHGAFEEAEKYRDQLRRLNHEIGFREALRRRQIFRVLSRPFSLYMDWVLRSFIHFSGTILAGLALFTIAFAAVMTFGSKESTIFLDEIPEAFYSTFRAMLAEIPNWEDLYPSIETASAAKLKPWTGGPLLGLNCAAAAFGLLNFGLLVSYLYTKVARK